MEKIKCKYCGKEFEGFSEKQVDNFLRQHIISKHKDKVIFKNGDEKGKKTNRRKKDIRPDKKLK